jgi:nicotinamidase-related amidase
MIDLDPKTTALVLIDLQNGILNNQLAPHSADEILTVSKSLADRFRAVHAPVVLVNVKWSDDFGDALRQSVDSPMQAPPGGFPAGWADFAPGLAKTATS